MTEPLFNTPVVFFLYRREDIAEQTFAVIRRIRPRTLFLVADGPQSNDEAEKCRRARRIVETIDWPCDVRRNYSDHNLGLRRRVVSGIEWVFEHVDRAIFIEDDVLVDESFFSFCEAMLEYYAADESVFQINGTSLHDLDPSCSIQTSYSFSRIPTIHGWATWKRSWRHFDEYLRDWPQTKKDFFENLPFEKKHRIMIRYFLDSVHHHLNTNERYAEWAWQWIYACLKQHAVCVLPCRSLATNIGSDDDGTNMKEPTMVNHLPRHPMRFPLRHPAATDRVDDKFLIDLIPTFFTDQRFRNRMERRLTIHAWTKR